MHEVARRRGEVRAAEPGRRRNGRRGERAEDERRDSGATNESFHATLGRFVDERLLGLDVRCDGNVSDMTTKITRHALDVGIVNDCEREPPRTSINSTFDPSRREARAVTH